MLNQKFSSGTKKEKWELGGAEKESGRREKKSVEDRGGEGRGREERKGTEGHSANVYTNGVLEGGMRGGVSLLTPLFFFLAGPDRHIN